MKHALAFSCSCVVAVFIISVTWHTTAGPSRLPCCNKAEFGFPRCDHFQEQVLFLYDCFGAPDLHQNGRLDPVLDMDLKLVEYVPEFGVVVSIHNQAEILAETIGSLLRQVRGLWEIVFIFDDCQDASLTVVQHAVEQWIESKQFQDTQCSTSLLTRVRFVVQPTSVWETSSDNIGMRMSLPSRFYLLIQPDMTDFETAFNLKLAAPFEIYSDLIAVSARCSHNLVQRNDGKDSAGRCGLEIANPLPNEDLLEGNNTLFVRDTINRGPLLLHADRIRTIGFLDEHNFYLADDDHNMALRAFTQYGWKSGHFQVNFSSPLQYGTTRNSEKPVLSDSQTQYLRGRKDQINLTHHHEMLEFIASITHWNEDRPVDPRQVESVIRQSKSRLQFVRRCHAQ